MTEPKKLDPIISEFATQEEADEYDAWFRKKVQESLDDPGSDIPHEEVMRRARETIERAAARGLAEGKQAAYEALDPIISEFATQEEADDYDAWFRKQVQESLDDPAPDVPHEEVMREAREVIRRAAERNRRRRA
jgi:hypothetical protein